MDRMQSQEALLAMHEERQRIAVGASKSLQILATIEAGSLKMTDHQYAT